MVERQEAVLVLRELLRVCPDLMNQAVSLDTSFLASEQIGGGTKISLRGILNDNSRQCLQPILEKHKLTLKETNDTITIYRSQ